MTTAGRRLFDHAPFVDPELLARLRSLRVALVHDWLTGMRGGERVLEAIASLFPGAEIFTLLHVPGSISAELEARSIHTSFVQRLPRAATAYRWYLPLFPWAIEALDLRGHDLVVSTSHCAAKAAVAPPGAVHASYCFTPMRYAWDQFAAYFSPHRLGRARYLAIRATIAWLRRWDRKTAERVDAFAADSRWVARRIDRYYSRPATVIPPPVDTGWFVPGPDDSDGDYWLVVSALAPYKRIDVAIEAFNRLRLPLRIAGSGPELERLRASCGPTIEMLGWVDDDRLRRLYQGCRGLVLPNVEDAGIVPLEAMACGRPAIVLDAGGAAETVIDGETGVLVPAGTGGADPADALGDAIDRAMGVTFNTERIREHALSYGPDVFARRVAEFIAEALESSGPRGGPASVADAVPAGRATSRTATQPEEHSP